MKNRFRKGISIVLLPAFLLSLPGAAFAGDLQDLLRTKLPIPGGQLDSAVNLEMLQKLRLAFQQNQKDAISQMHNRAVDFLAQKALKAGIRDKLKDKLATIQVGASEEQIEAVAQETGVAAEEVINVAAEETKEQIAKNPDAQKLRKLAWLHRFLKNHDKAREALEWALRLNPQSLELLKELGEAKKAMGQSNYDLFIAGQKQTFDVPPFLHESGRTMLPFRKLAEVLGAEVQYDADARKVIMIRGGKVIVLFIDQRKALVDGKEVELELPAMIRDGRTMVPLRFVSERLGLKVNWQPGNVISVDDEEVVAPVDENEGVTAEEPTTGDPTTTEEESMMADTPVDDTDSGDNSETNL